MSLSKRGSGRGCRLWVPVLFLLHVPCAAWASPAGAGNVTAALLSEQAAVAPGQAFHVGLRMTIRRGWHTYWRNPGDSGLPPKITWNLPEGFTAGPIEWPAPERIRENSLMSYGYTGEVLLPVEITPPARIAADSVTVAGTLEWLECADVCLPGSSALRLTLPVRPGAPGSEPPAPGPAAPLFAEARSRIPAAPVGWSFRAEAGPRAISLQFDVPSGISPRAGYLYVDQPLVTDYAAPQGFERVGGGCRLTLTPAPNAQGQLERLTGVLVTEGRAGGARTAVRVDVPVTPGDPAPAPAAGTRPPSPWTRVAAALSGLGLAILLLRSIRIGWKKSGPRPEPKG